MATEAQVVANRQNAQKSTGPRTAEGKAVASQNAVKHGLSAQCDVIRGEEQEEFNQYREELFWELVPVGIMESRLVERIVSLAWRLRRAERIHNEAFDALLAREASSSLSWITGSFRPRGSGQSADGAQADLSPGVIAAKDFANSRVLDRLLMYERRIEASLYRTMAELRKLRHERELEASAPARSRNPRYSAKQSQIPPTEGGHSPHHETAGVTPDGTDCAEQSQFPPADGGVCRVPVRASLEDRLVGSLQTVAAGAGNCAKQSQSAGTEMMAPHLTEKGWTNA